MMDQADLLMQYKGMVVLLFLVFFLLIGRFFPFSEKQKTIANIAKNFALSGVNAALSLLVIIPIITLTNHWNLAWRPELLQGWAGLIFDLLVLDLWIYWWHRTMHIVPFLWRFHEVHHLDETLDASSALRFHFGEVVISSLVRVPFVILLGIPVMHVLAFETLVAVAAIFHHSNVRLPLKLERYLSLVIVTPAIHWVHHHAVRADTDSNYAVFLSVWDRLFSSRSNTVRTAEMHIGVEGRHDQSFWKLIAWPFSQRALS